jgi:alkylhydroperoxidase family enzyme
VQPWLGERAAVIFSHAISSETDCLICSTFFRRILIDWGENPDELVLDEREQLLVEFGRALSSQFSRVPNELYARLAAEFDGEQIVALTAFGAMMVATNIVNNALEVELDEYLDSYRAQATPSTGRGNPSTSSG